MKRERIVSVCVSTNQYKQASQLRFMVYAAQKDMKLDHYMVDVVEGLRLETPKGTYHQSSGNFFVQVC